MPPSLPFIISKSLWALVGPPWAVRRTDKKTKRGSEARQGESERERDEKCSYISALTNLQVSSLLGGTKVPEAMGAVASKS